MTKLACATSYRIGAEDRVPGNPSLAFPLTDDSINMAPSLNFEHCTGRKTAKIDTTFYFGLNNIAVDRIAAI